MARQRQPSPLKCAVCKKAHGDHKEGTLNCPMGMRHRAGTYSYFSKDQYFTLPLPDVSIRTRRLLERFDVRAREWGRMHEFGTGPTVELAEREFRQARTALYKRIAELEDALSKES